MVAPATHDPDVPEAKVALAWLHTARFLTTAARLEQLPPAMWPEIAFVGRSNAGKSTAINRLTQHRHLAFASRTPGRTQHINLFELGPKGSPEAVIADLPGYGYAAVERAAKLRWQAVMASYLQLRPNLRGVVLLLDSRLGLTELDRRLLELIVPRLDRVALLVLLTKCDKLGRQVATAALRATVEALEPYAAGDADIGVALFSALTRTGVDDAACTLHAWAHR